MRRAAKKDANQGAIVQALRKCGASVHVLNEAGAPDLLVGIRGLNLLVEVKDGAKCPSARRLTAAQLVWHKAWKGQVWVLDSVDGIGTLLARATEGEP